MTPTAAHPDLDDLLAAQAGVLSRAQAVAAGLSTDAVDRRLAARRWLPVHPRVYRDAGHPDSAQARVRAVVLWAGEGAVLSGAAAAWWWGLLPRVPDPVTVTVPRRRAPRPRDGIVVRRRTPHPADVTVRNGLAVTGRAWSVLETAVELPGSGGAFLDRVLAAPPGSAAPDLAELTAAHWRGLGTHGSRAAGELLAGAARRFRDAAGHRVRTVLVRAGVTGWRCDVPVAGLVVPLAFPAHRLAVEIRGGAGPDPAALPGTAPDTDAGTDGGTGSRTDGVTDSGTDWRRAVLRRQGWRVLMLDPADVLHRSDVVPVAVRGALAGSRPGPGAPALRVAG